MLRRYRAAHDSLAEICPPHITLVFPSDSPANVGAWLRAAEDVSHRFEPVDVGFERGAIITGETVQLVVDRGRTELPRIHLALSVQIGTPSQVAYVPHVTVGRGADLVVPSWLEKATVPGQTLSKLVVEEIGPNEESLVQGVFELKGS